LITLISVLFLLSASTQEHSKSGTEFFVRTKSNVPIERLATAIAPYGKIDSRKRGSSLFLVHLKPGVADALAKKRLAQIPGAHLLSIIEEQAELRGVRELGEPLAGFGGGDDDESLPVGGVVAVRNRENMEYRRVAPNAKDLQDKGKKPETGGPDEAAKWRRLALVDEHGQIPPNALQRALAQKRALIQSAKPMTGGQNWIEEGPSNFSGRSRVVVIDPTNPLRLWMGAVGGGVWRSLDGGQTWAAVGDGLPSLAVCTLVLDPNDNKTLYAGTGEGYFNGDSIAGMGVFKSVDGGSTWTQLPGSAGWTWSHINRIAVCPGNSNLILVTQQYGGVFRSTDGGQTFSNPFWAQSGHAVAFCPTNPNRVIGTIQDYDFNAGQWYAAAIYSTDAGATWTKSNGLSSLWGFGRVETCPVPKDQNTVFASASDGNVYKSTDGGVSYKVVNTNGTTSANWYANCIWVDPTNSNRLVITGTYVYGSTDGGATINLIGQGYIQTDQPHPDDHYVVAAPGYDGVTNKTVYICSDGGLYATNDITSASTNGGWFRLDQGARSTQYYSVAGDGPANFFVGGLQDNGSESNQLGNGNAYCFFGGDGGYVAIDPTNSQHVYGEYIDLELFRDDDGATGGNSNWIYGGIADAGNNANFIAPFILDPNQPLTLLAGGASLWRTTNATDPSPSWSAIRSPGSDLLSAIAVANGNSDIIWVGQNDGGIAMTTNGTAANPTWTTINTHSGGPIPGRYVTRILLDPDHSNIVYVTLGGFSSNNVWKSTDSGATWNALNGTGSGVLPQVPVRAIARRPAAPNTLYVGTEIGVFSTTDGGNTWTTTSDMTINVSVDDLQYMNNSVTLLAATHGRGIWALPYGPGVLKSLTVAPSAVVSGGSSTGTVTLNNPSGAGGVVISLSSDNPAAVVPATVTIPAGQQMTTFTVTTLGVSTVTTANITASMSNITAKATLTINPATLIGVSVTPTTVAGGVSSTGTVTLQGIAGPNGTNITLTSNSASVSVPGTVTVAANASTATFTVTTTPVASTTTATITATLGSANQTAAITVTPPSLSSISLAPSTVAGGTPSTGTVTISGPAPTGGMLVGLTSSSTSATVPSSVTIAAGATTTTFNIPTTAVSKSTTANIFATISGVAKFATLMITPTTLSSISISPNTVPGGTSATGTATLNGPAPLGGITVALNSSTSNATVPASVTIPSGSTSATFNIGTTTVQNSVTATITGTLNGNSVNGTLTILPPLLSAVSVSPVSVVGGNSATGTVTLSRPAPTGGASVTLSASAGATVPVSVTIGAGATTANFNITTTGQATAISATLSATFAGTTRTTTLTITPAGLVGLSISPNTVAGGNTPIGTVTLNGAAPVTGTTITLASNSASASTPKTVTVPSGASSATFAVATTPVSSSVNATISATLGATTLTSALTIQPAVLSTLTLSPANVVGGSDTQVIGVVRFNGLAPSTGEVVTLSSSSTALATVPATVKVLSGTASISFTVNHKLVTSTKTVTITATYAGVKLTANLNIGPFQLVSVALNPSSVIGGNKVSGTVLLNAQPGSSGVISVKLTSSSKSLTVPATAAVTVGSLGGIFSATTAAVATSTTATVTGTYGSSTAQTSATILPATLIAVSVSPTSVKGSATTAVTGTVSLNGLAPTGGLVVKLTSSNTGAATVPASVTIPAGKATATFKVTHTKVSAQTAVTISASLAGTTQTTSLTVTP